MAAITCLSHPVSVLFVDDNESFLDTVAHDLRSQGKLIICTEPQKALEILKQSNETMSTVVQKLDHSDRAEYPVDFRLSQLLQTLYNPNRNQFIAVAVIDYDMPGMNGVELAEQLTDSPVGKIILTMKGDEKLAMQTFNKHLIDQFLFKTADNAMYKELVPAIEHLKLRYFDRLSQGIVSALGESFKNLMKSTSFQKVFAQAYQEANAIEYYLVDQYGSFLFLDKAAKPTWLIIRNEATMQEQIGILEDMDMPSETVGQLTNRQKLLFMPTDEDIRQASSTLSEYLFGANKLCDGYYYSVTQGKITRLVDWDKLTTCQID